MCNTAMFILNSYENDIFCLKSIKHIMGVSFPAIPLIFFSSLKGLSLNRCFETKFFIQFTFFHSNHCPWPYSHVNHLLHSTHTLMKCTQCQKGYIYTINLTGILHYIQLIIQFSFGLYFHENESTFMKQSTIFLIVLY